MNFRRNIMDNNLYPPNNDGNQPLYDNNPYQPQDNGYQQNPYPPQNNGYPQDPYAPQDNGYQQSLYAPPQNYGYPPPNNGYYVQPLRKDPGNGFGVASLICGIFGILFSMTFGVGALAGIAAVILSVISGNRSTSAGFRRSGVAIGGMVCGIIAIIFGALCVACYISLFAAAGSEAWDEYYYSSF